MKRAAVRRLAAAEWGRSFGEPLGDGDPTETVLNEIRWTAGHVAWLRDRVAEVEPEALIWGVSTEVDRQSGEFPGLDITRAAKAHAWLELYGQERDRLVRMCKIAHDMGIAQRQIELSERVGDLIAALLRAVLDELGLSPEQWEKANQATIRHLRLIAGSLEG
ncbi:hypothetical protein [Acrocarpospora phusangensis]|uniref:hypothetical protein n=1 Tax=Acrocarpospora phusangensis TaxID=1070424 RepID=UPI00194DC6A2|nr:hypothetical protein [Acrocarpospora phusangensis]